VIFQVGSAKLAIFKLSFETDRTIELNIQMMTLHIRPIRLYHPSEMMTLHIRPIRLYHPGEMMTLHIRPIRLYHPSETFLFRFTLSRVLLPNLSESAICCYLLISNSSGDFR